MVKELRGGAKNPSLNCNNRDTEQDLGFTLRMMDLTSTTTTTLCNTPRLFIYISYLLVILLDVLYHHLTIITFVTNTHHKHLTLQQSKSGFIKND